MKPTIGELTGRLSSLVRIGKAAGWDPIGLQFGDRTATVDSVAVCHEVTPAVADRLVAEQVDLAVSYHPLLFRPTRSLVAGPHASGRAFRLISAGVALYTVHTAFDVVAGGTADQLAEALGLVGAGGFAPAWGADVSKVVTFVPADNADAVAAAMVGAGAGQIGDYSACSFRSPGTGTFLPGESSDPAAGTVGVVNHEEEIRLEMIAPRHSIDRVVAALARAHPYEEPAFDVIEVSANAGFVGRRGSLPEALTVAQLADLVSDRLGGVVRVAGAGTVSSVAVIPGSGGSLLSAVDADVVVTGDVSHHQARDATARGLAVIDPGHAATERPGVRALYALVADTFEEAIDMTEVDPDPWRER